MTEHDPTPAWMLSTPQIKNELRTLLNELVPDQRWPKRTQLKDLVAFALDRFGADTADAGEHRALELAREIHAHERR